MASLNPIEEEITCSVCMEVFKDPYVLIKCLHTFCLECIQLLEQDGQVQCPQCRAYCMSTDIKKDFRTQSFISAYQVEKKNLKEFGSLDIAVAEGAEGTTPFEGEVCGMCKKRNKPPGYRCLECEHFLCADCKAAHQRIKLCSKHTVLDVADMIAKSKEQITRTIDRLDEKLKDVQKECTSMEELMADVSQGERTQLQDIDRYTEEAILQLQKHKQTTKQLILEVNAQKVNELTNRKKLLDKATGEVKERKVYLTEQVTERDMAQPGHTQQVTSKTEREVDQIIKGLKLATPLQTSAVKVRKNTQWKVEDYLKVDRVDKSVATQDQPRTYANLLNTQFVSTYATDLDRSPYVLSMVNDEVWCAGNYKIAVYSLQCDHLRNISIDKIRGARGLTHIHNTNQVIVACKNRGVHQIDSKGHYHSLIIEGSFSDVCVDAEQANVYALEFRKGLVFVLKYTEKWTCVRHIKLTVGSDINGSDSDRLSVFGDQMYVSRWNRSYSYRAYKLSGEMLQKVTCESHVDMLLCDLDWQGNMLVVDYSKGHVLVCDTQQVWTTLNIEGAVAYPLCAMVDSNGCLWITEKWSLFSKAKLIKFSSKQHF